MPTVEPRGTLRAWRNWLAFSSRLGSCEYAGRVARQVHNEPRYFINVQFESEAANHAYLVQSNVSTDSFSKVSSICTETISSTGKVGPDESNRAAD